MEKELHVAEMKQWRQFAQLHCPWNQAYLVEMSLSSS